MNTKSKKENDKKSGLMELSRSILLAGIGAAVLAQEEIENFVNKLQEKGEIAEQDGRKLINEIKERREKINQERKLEQDVDQAKMATKKDVEDLTAKVEELTEMLKKIKSSSDQS